MVVLSLESSTLYGGVALLNNDRIVAKEFTLRQKSHSEVMNLFLENVLTSANTSLSQIDLIACGQGPGSFTGIRVAANIAKTISYVYSKPIFTIDTMLNIALSNDDSDLPYLSIINAYKNMVYYSIISKRGYDYKVLVPPSVIPVKYLESVINQNCHVVGDGYDTYSKYFSETLKNKIHRPKNPIDLPSAETLALLAKNKYNQGLDLHWNTFLPLYLRASEAEETQKGILFTPLS